MFDFVRQHTRLALGLMLLLIIPSFVFFGVQGYSSFGEAGNDTVAQVGRVKVTRVEWDNAHKRAVDQMRRQAPNIDAAQFETPAARRDTLEALLRERVQEAAAAELHLQPTPQRMARLFDADPQYAGLRGPDGRISRELLVGQGLTPEMFDQRMRQEMASRQVLNGITQTVPVATLVAATTLDAFMQRREVQLQRFDPATYRAKIAPTDAEIETWFKANEASFRAPEQAKIEYVVLDLEVLGRSVKIEDTDVQKAYADAAARYSTPEERRASHILIKADKDTSAADRAKAKARAEALLAEARKNPAQFAELARKNSSDAASAAQGGDLDFFGRGQMVPPFENAVFALKKGAISDVVESDFGYHVILLTDVRGGQSKPLESVRGEVEAELRKSKALAKWAEAAEQFTNTVYEQSDSLKPAIDKLKLDKQTATVQRKPAPGATGVLASARLLEAVFSNDALVNKRNTDAIEVGPNRLVAAHVLEHQPARAQTLADVKDRVREAVVEQQAAALARKEGQARLTALRAKPDEALAGPTLTVSRLQAQGMPPQVLDTVLRADPAKLPAASGIDLGPKIGYVVLRVTRVLPREDAPTGDEPLRAQYAQAWANAEADAYLASLKTRFKAEVKPAASMAVDAASAPSR